MRLVDYQNEVTGEIREFIRLELPPHPKTIEHEGETWRHKLVAPRIVTADTRKFVDWPDEKKLARAGKRIIEPGTHDDALRNKRDRLAKQDAALEETVVASVNKAMP